MLKGVSMEVLLTMTFTLLSLATLVGLLDVKARGKCKAPTAWTILLGFMNIWFFLAPLLTRSNEVVQSHFFIVMVTTFAILLLPVRSVDAAFGCLSLHGMGLSGLFPAHVGWKLPLPNAVDDLVMSVGGLAFLNVFLILFLARDPQEVPDEEPLFVIKEAYRPQHMQVSKQTPDNEELVALSKAFLAGEIDTDAYKEACRRFQ